MPVVFGIAFMAVALPRVSGIDCVNDIALFVESKAAVVRLGVVVYGVLVRLMVGSLTALPAQIEVGLAALEA